MRWYLVKGTEKLGPLTAQQLKERMQSGSISPDAVVVREGTPVKKRLGDVLAQLSKEEEDDDSIQFVEAAQDGRTLIARPAASPRPVASPRVTVNAVQSPRVATSTSRETIIGTAPQSLSFGKRKIEIALQPQLVAPKVPLAVAKEQPHAIKGPLQDVAPLAPKRRVPSRPPLRTSKVIPKEFGLRTDQRRVVENPDGNAKRELDILKRHLIHEKEKDVGNRLESEDLKKQIENLKRQIDGLKKTEDPGLVFHQLPEIASDAQFNTKKGKLAWQKNRINPTYPQSVPVAGFIQRRIASVQPTLAKVRSGLGANKKNELSPTAIFVGIGGAFVVFILTVVAIVKRQGNIEEINIRRQILNSATTKIQPKNDVVFDGGMAIDTNSSNTNNGNNINQNSIAERKREARRNDEKRAQEIKMEEKKQEDKRAEMKKEELKRENARRENARRENVRRENLRRENARRENIENEENRVAEAKKFKRENQTQNNMAQREQIQKPIVKTNSVPGNWPKPVATTGAVLLQNAFKVLSVDEIVLDNIPINCAPCRTQGTLSDGTSVTLVSPTSVPWQAAIAGHKIAVKGLIQKKPEGIWILVQEIVSR